MAYLGAAPLTLVRTTAGPAAYVYAGQPAPEGIDDEQLDRLVAEGYLVEVDDVVLDEAVVVVPDDPADGSAGPGVTVERPAVPLEEQAVVVDADGVEHVGVLPMSSAIQRPKRTAPKADWLAYRGVAAERAEEFNIGQLQDDDAWPSSPAV